MKTLCNINFEWKKVKKKYANDDVTMMNYLTKASLNSRQCQELHFCQESASKLN